ncbi:MAG: sigma-70 family RNA polymerase sigma factor [Polyangia bacterium]
MGRIAEEDAGLQLYLHRIERYDELDREQELELATRAQAGDHAAADRLVTCTLRYVVRIALRYRGYGIRVADLVEEGNLGLLEAVGRYDVTRNLRFMTYASFWVRAYILAHVLKQSHLVGVGTGPLQSKMFFRLARERGRIVSSLGSAVSTEEVERQLAVKFGTTVERIREIGSRIEGHDVSLDAQVFRDGTTTALELLPDEHESADSSLASQRRDAEVRRRLNVVLKTLPEREQYIVNQRLMSDEEATLADIGRTLRLSRERVRQLETRVKGKLRRAFEGLEVAAAS